MYGAAWIGKPVEACYAEVMSGAVRSCKAVGSR